ncbi:MAG: molybdopterin-guanine dinucleotide biosynthesis protein B [Rhodospirillaceae bacterium]
MKIFGLAGWSGSGKTTLLVKLLPLLIGRGLTVSTIKHAHHDFDIDRPGKDSQRHREAGASEVLIGSARRWALIHEHRAAPEPSLAELLSHMMPVDLVLVEGFKRDNHLKLEVWRSANGKPLLSPGDPQIVGVACDEVPSELHIPRLDLNDVEAIADFILARCGL